ncbi:rhomboid family intramembrane serine protease [Terriglobus tenax]|uniref:rhomboid family intramembrane serine protease n=1 Tax=Terriglobus tenax TaxID=1111115 RepID=UPI0021DF5875|nr:rhomboid family intramembrane serine protease [Terriglobus tenax]
MDPAGQSSYSAPEAEVLPPETQPQNRRSSGWNFLAAPATYTLVGVNCAVFAWMVLHGVSPTLPSSRDLQHYGANISVLVLEGQWWRLLTAMFVHVGMLHLATNMWCLWNLGLLGEPLLGRRGMIFVYILTGAAGNLLSMAFNVMACIWDRDWCPLMGSAGAGASGAVFGLAGILIVLLSNRNLPIPWPELKKLRGSVIQFAILNLAIGLATMVFDTGIHIDNMAHVGGFVCGLAMGFPLLPRMTSGREKYLTRQTVTFLGAGLVLALFGYWLAHLR